MLPFLKGKEFYNRLKTYILTEEQLRENGFPRPGLDGGSKVQFYKEEDIGESLKGNIAACVSQLFLHSYLLYIYINIYSASVGMVYHY